MFKYSWIPKDFDRLGGLILRELIITVKKEVDPKANDWASFDINLMNVTALIDGKIERYDTRELYHIHRTYEIKRQRVQKLVKFKPETSKRLLKKYSKREMNRAKDFLHKFTTKLAKELREKNCGAILEDLRGIKDRVLNRSSNMNRKLSKWNALIFQFMLDYKLKWLGLLTKYINPKNSSKTCPLCSGHMVTYEGRLMRCEECSYVMDRDVVAVLNLQMWGVGFPLKALNETKKVEREGSGRNKSNEELYIPT